MKVAYCSGFEYMPDAPQFLGVRQGMEELGWEYCVVDPIMATSTEAVSSQINAFSPDLVIHAVTVVLSRGICQRIDPAIPQVFWMLDYALWEKMDQTVAETWLANASSLDALFVCSEDHILPWSEAFDLPTYFAPQACYKPNELQYSKQFDFDVVFIGTTDWNAPFRERAEFLEELKHLSPVEITHINETERLRRNEVFRNIPLYYFSSKLVLDISHFWESWGYTSSRFWDAAAFGGCNIVKRFPGCSQFFPEPLKWYFDTPQEAAELIELLLSEDEVRAESQMNAQLYAWERHSWAVRLEKMVRCLETGEQISMV